MSELTEEYKAELKRHIEVMQAASDGKVIQYRHRDSKRWYTDSGCPLGFNWISNEYRVKPEPKRLWVNHYGDGTYGAGYSSRDKALQCAGKKTIATEEYIQVLPDNQ